jgi:FKBP-type peptidyl-prolyl cis-trans isomerase
MDSQPHQPWDGQTLMKKVIQEGTGETCPNGVQAIVHYTGKFLTGQPFDSSYNRNQPFQFTVGAGQVIKGWDICVASMKIGEKCLLLVPPHMGYGASGVGGVIPPNAVLAFDIELLGWN